MLPREPFVNGRSWHHAADVVVGKMLVEQFGNLPGGNRHIFGVLTSVTRFCRILEYPDLKKRVRIHGNLFAGCGFHHRRLLCGRSRVLVVLVPKQYIPESHNLYFNKTEVPMLV